MGNSKSKTMSRRGAIQIIPSVFRGPRKEGDFLYMIKSGNYEDALFIFNDNEMDHRTPKIGGGNAVIRQFNKYSRLEKPRSAGIPTGSFGGYSKLDADAKSVIDAAINDIRELLAIHGYQRVYFSADLSGKLGTSIFQIGDDVRDYITEQIMNLGN
jgi:hypothetical protein